MFTEILTVPILGGLAGVALSGICSSSWKKLTLSERTVGLASLFVLGFAMFFLCYFGLRG